MGEHTSTLSTIITWTIIGLLAIMALKVAMGLVGFVLGLAFTLIPLLIVGWIVVKAWKAFTRDPAEPA